MQQNGARPLRVIQVCDLQAGGISSIILSLCEEMDREKVNFDYLVYRDQPEFEDRRAQRLGGRKLIADGTNTANRAVRLVRKFVRTGRILRREQAEIFHINGSTPYDFLVGMVARLAGVRTVILHAHNSRLKKSSRLHRGLQGLFRTLQPLCGDWYFACSDLAGEFMFGSRCRRKVIEVKNGIHTRRFRFDGAVREQMRAEYGLQDALVVGHIGRMVPAKNQSFLLEVFAELLRLRPDARLVLIGSGELEEALMAQAGRMGLVEKLTRIPSTSQPERFYCMMDLFMLPSLFEGLPVVGVEAQASGLPCIFSDSITRELAITDRAHYLGLDRSPAEWAELAAALAAETPRNREEYAGRVREGGFEIEDVAAWLQEFYLSL